MLAATSYAGMFEFVKITYKILMFFFLGHDVVSREIFHILNFETDCKPTLCVSSCCSCVIINLRFVSLVMYLSIFLPNVKHFLFSL